MSIGDYLAAQLGKKANLKNSAFTDVEKDVRDHSSLTCHVRIDDRQARNFRDSHVESNQSSSIA